MYQLFSIHVTRHAVVKKNRYTKIRINFQKIMT